MSPLPPPSWFDRELDVFHSAATLIANGIDDRGQSELDDVQGEQLRWWFSEHGQQSARFRSQNLMIARPVYSGVPDRPLTRSIEQAVFRRDNYRCRYCGLRTLSKSFLRAFEGAVGAGRFSASKNDNKIDHGIVLAFKAVADHVVPRNLGGRTDANNLVTACPSCNYGKYNYTIEQLGIDDPRDRLVLHNEWDGLSSLVAELSVRATTYPPSLEAGR